MSKKFLNLVLSGWAQLSAKISRHIFFLFSRMGHTFIILFDEMNDDMEEQCNDTKRTKADYINESFPHNEDFSDGETGELGKVVNLYRM